MAERVPATDDVPGAADVRHNLSAAAADLAAARVAGDDRRAVLIEALIHSGGSLFIYRPERDHYGVLLGDLELAVHVAVVVPGVGTDTNLRVDWIPAARNLFDALESAAVILWKGYDNPGDPLHAALLSVECDAHLMDSGRALSTFVQSLALRPDQTLTIVAHSLGSVVTGAALADHDLRCTDVVVAGSPGMTVDDLRQLHLEQSHFFSEGAPGDPVAGLGIFGAAPTSPAFGGTRMRTNAVDHVAVKAHGDYFVRGSESLENIANVVMGRYGAVVARPSSLAEVLGGLVAWTMRIPALPIGMVSRRYRGPGFRVLLNTRRLIDVTATETGNVVRDAADHGAHLATRFLGRPG